MENKWSRNITWPDGRKYVGEWKDGKRMVKEHDFTDGSKYVGEWKNGRTWNGIQYDKDGNIYRKVCEWKSKRTITPL